MRRSSQYVNARMLELELTTGLSGSIAKFSPKESPLPGEDKTERERELWIISNQPRTTEKCILTKIRERHSRSKVSYSKFIKLEQSCTFHMGT